MDPLKLKMFTSRKTQTLPKHEKVSVLVILILIWEILFAYL